jgi:sec-independent protein translocase protein TatC
MPFLEHLIELRDRLLRIVLAVVVVLAGLLPFANPLYSWLAQPLLRHMPAGTSMIATEVASPFLTPFKLTLVLAVFVAMPFALYQAWAFIAPGLYRHERRFALPLLASSVALFYLGMAFAYYVVFPIIFGFFTATAPEGVQVMTDINKYLDFVLTLFFAFGVAFEVPIATILLVWTGLTTPQALARARPYVIVGAFVIGMLITPPDVFSQTFVALPMVVLYEAGIVLSRALMKARRDTSDDEPEAEADRADAADRAQPPAGDARVVPADQPLTGEALDRELDRAIAEEDSLGRGTGERPPAP